MNESNCGELIGECEKCESNIGFGSNKDAGGRGGNVDDGNRGICKVSGCGVDMNGVEINPFSERVY